MTADERLSLIRVKVQGAQEYIRNLNAQIRAFLSTPPEPYVIATKRDPQTRELVYYVSAAAEQVPSRIASIAGDVVQNLRSALDYLAFQLVIVGRPGITPGRQICFPICENAAQYRSKAPGKIKGMRQDAIKAINALKPYKGGNDLLWALNRLNNINKHRTLIMVGAAHVGHSLTPRIRETLRTALSQKRVSEIRKGFPELLDQISFVSLDARTIKCPLKKGDELFRDAPDAEVDKDMQMHIEVVFGEPQILPCTMVVPTLLRMADSIDDIVVGFKPHLA
jgi:hypothetical protein